jgi:hypothetical protein
VASVNVPSEAVDVEVGCEAERALLSELLSRMGGKYPDVPVQRFLALGLPDTSLVTAPEKMDVVVGS